jgi:adenine-specific DNA-methyltransferase
MFREPKPGYEEVMDLAARLNPSYPPIAEVESEIRALYKQHKVEYREQMEAKGLDWETEKGNDPWKGIFNYNRAEYRDTSGLNVPEAQAEERKATIWVWREADASMPATKQAASTRDSAHPNWRFYKPPHPVTGQPCPHPKSGWKFAYEDDEDSPDRRSFVSLDRDCRIAWGPDEKKVPQLKRFLHEVETNIGKSVFQDYSDGEKQTSAMFGRSGVFLAPKHANFVARFIVHAATKDGIVLDCFAGSGSTAHAVLDLNREDRGTRKYVLVEVGEYFDTVLKPRVLKAAYSRDWKDGKPVSRQGVSHFVKVLRLESYEDTLNNLHLRRPAELQAMLDSNAEARADYLLRYMLDLETRDSPSLLDLQRFKDPFSYCLDINWRGEVRPVAVDLVETFNWLLGLQVDSVWIADGFHAVEGTDPAGQRVVAIWRTLSEDPQHDDDALA